MPSICRLIESHKVFEHGSDGFVFFVQFLSPQVALWDKIDWTGKTGLGPEGGHTGASDFPTTALGRTFGKGWFCSIWIHTLSFSHSPGAICSGLSQANHGWKRKEIFVNTIRSLQRPCEFLRYLFFSLRKLRTYFCRCQHSPPGTRPRNAVFVCMSKRASGPT